MVDIFFIVEFFVLNGFLGNNCNNEDFEGFWLVDLFLESFDRLTFFFLYFILDFFFGFLWIGLNLDILGIVGVIIE